VGSYPVRYVNHPSLLVPQVVVLALVEQIFDKARVAIHEILGGFSNVPII